MRVDSLPPAVHHTSHRQSQLHDEPVLMNEDCSQSFTVFAKICKHSLPAGSIEWGRTLTTAMAISAPRPQNGSRLERLALPGRSASRAPVAQAVAQQASDSSSRLTSGTESSWFTTCAVRDLSHDYFKRMMQLATHSSAVCFLILHRVNTMYRTRDKIVGGHPDGIARRKCTSLPSKHRKPSTRMGPAGSPAR